MLHVKRRGLLSRNKLPIGIPDLRKLACSAGLGSTAAAVDAVSPIAYVMQVLPQFVGPGAQCLRFSVRFSAFWTLLGRLLCTFIRSRLSFPCALYFLLESWSEGLPPMGDYLQILVLAVSGSTAQACWRGVSASPSL